MASLYDICVQLGFSEDFPRSRGYPNVLRGDLQSFSQTWSWIRSIDWLADLYLCQNGKKIFQRSEYHLDYPGDRGKIMDLVAQAFRLLRGTKSDEDSEETSTVQAEATGSKLDTSNDQFPPTPEDDAVILDQPVATSTMNEGYLERNRSSLLQHY
ncbi:MAG: hypothetical protein Q9225_002070 [Loekoesia sp. 1 TL-2023]